MYKRQKKKQDDKQERNAFTVEEVKRLDTYRDPSGALELYGFIEWTPRGQQMLADKEYTQSSTEYLSLIHI